MQELHNAPNYQAKIQSVSLKKAATATATGLMTVKYAVVNPKTGAAYNLREGCSGAATTDQAGTSIPSCKTNYRWDVTGGAPQDKFGTFTLYLATETLAGVTLDDNTNNNTLAAYLGVADASNNYTADLTIPAGAKGNARVMLLGSVAERRLDPLTRNPIGAVPPTANSDLAYVPVENAIKDVNVATGGASARRAIVSNENCNSCHATLGLPMGPQEVAFHKGVRNNGDGCAICHNANQNSSYTFMSDGSVGPVAGDGQLAAGNTSAFLHESWQAKRFVHGIHYGAMRNYPFTHGNNVPGTYNKDGTNAVAGGPSMPASAINFTAEVAYPGALKNCSNCHVNDSWKQDRSVLGTVVFRPAGKTNMLDWMVLSPKAATCTTCHDAKSVQTHVMNIGGGAFGNVTQNDLLYGGKVFEACEGCHAPGSALGVDKAHAFK
jgi:OmcA/MtrC family decaheme c-type cytochrome